MMPSIVFGAKIRVFSTVPTKAAVRGPDVRATTRSHAPEHHAQIVCGHFGDNRSRESNRLRDRGNRFEVSKAPVRVAIAKTPVECLVLGAVANPSRM
jgi:hypothetical protein